MAKAVALSERDARKLGEIFRWYDQNKNLRQRYHRLNIPQQPPLIKAFKVQSEAAGDGVYTCYEQVLDASEWDDTAGDNKFDNKEEIPTEIEVFNIAEYDPEAEYIAHLTADDMLIAFPKVDDEGNSRWMGIPLRQFNSDRSRIAYCKDDAGEGTTIDCYLDKDGSGTEITVHCGIAQGGADLNEAVPRLKDGDLIYVEKINDDTNDYWRCIGVGFMPSEDCECTESPLAIADGGTGATTAAGAASALGVGTEDTPAFTGCNLGTGELTTGSINRAADTLTLEIGGVAQVSITSTATTLAGNLDAGANAITAATYNGIILNEGVAPNQFQIQGGVPAEKTLLVSANCTLDQDLQTTATGVAFVGMSLGTGAGEGFGSSFIPKADGSYDLGNATYKWDDLYLDSDIYLSDADPQYIRSTGMCGVIGTGEFILKLNSDADDYIQFKTTNHVPEITTVGSCNLKLNSTASIVIASGWTAAGQTCANLGTVTLGALGNDVTQAEWDAAYGWGDHASGGYQAQGDVLDDLNTLGANAADSEFLVGTGAGALAWESGATARTSIGLGTGDSPTFTGLTLSGTLDLDADLDLDSIVTSSFGHGLVALRQNNHSSGIWHGAQTALNFTSNFRPDTDYADGSVSIYGCYGVAKVTRDNCTGTVAALGAFYGSCQTLEAVDGGAITVTNAYDYFASPIAKNADDTITTAMGVYVAAQTVGGTNYGIYVAGAADSTSAYFEGDISADDVTDRAQWSAWKGTSKEALDAVLAIDKNGDHGSLPESCQRTFVEQKPTGEKTTLDFGDGNPVEVDVTEPVEVTGRSLSAMVTLLVESTKELNSRIGILEKAA